MLIHAVVSPYPMHSLGVRPFQDAVPELLQTGGPELLQRGSPDLFQTGCPELLQMGGAVTGATPPISWVYRHRTPVLIHITSVGAALSKGCRSRHSDPCRKA